MRANGFTNTGTLARSGEARYRCRDCLRCFQLDYRYEGNKQGVPERIIAMALNGSGVRDTSWVLGVSITTVIAHLKKLRPAAVNPLPIQALVDRYEVQLVCEMDEQWSYVGSKQQQRWLWYAWLPHLKTVLAYTFGARTDDTLKRLLTLIEPWSMALYCTDGWEAYQRYLPEDKHLIAKRYTQLIERQNLNFRTRIKRLARKTLCFSKSVEIHDKILGEFINRNFFNSSNA